MNRIATVCVFALAFGLPALLRQFGTSLWAFILVLGVIIFVHELGHFLTAKAFGMRVYIFSFGFGRRLAGFSWGGTDCRLSMIPLGGYVKLEGEPDDRLSEKVAASGGEHDFTHHPRWQRFLMYLAGPVMNVVLTVVLVSVLFMIGWYVDASLYDRPVIGTIEQGSGAEAAGLQPGDEILSLDGKEMATWEQFQIAVLLRPDTNLVLKIRRGVSELDLTVHSRSAGSEKTGHIGVAPLVRIGRVRPGEPAEAAGLLRDDAILRIGDQPVALFEDIRKVVTSAKTAPLAVHLLRDGKPLDLTVTPRDGRIGIEPKTVARRFGPVRAVAEAIRFAWDQTKLTFETVWRLVTVKISPKSMMGPLGIARASGDAARGGLGSLFFLIAVISLQVGILNLFPLAPLDGGHLLLLAGEGLVRRDFSMTVKTWVVNAGAIVLFLLIGFVVYSDLSKTSWLSKYLP